MTVRNEKFLSLIFIVLIFLFLCQFFNNDHAIAKPSYNNNDIFVKLNKQDNSFRIERYGSIESSSASVISVYFQLNKSKHSHDEYLKWLNNFILSVSSPMIIVTDSKASILDLIKLRKFPTSLYVVNSIWDVMKEISTERNRNYTENYIYRQNSLDREKHIHNPSLYAIWNLKSFISNKIANENFYRSSAFIYTDGI